jgi:hypothetical protein
MTIKGYRKGTHMRLRGRLLSFVKKYNIEQLPTGELVFYKVVTRDFGSWWVANQREFKRRNKCPQDKCMKSDRGAYRPGTEVKCKQYSVDKNNPCGKGLHIGTLACAKILFNTLWDPMPDYIIKVLVKPKDIVCIPIKSLQLYTSDGEQKLRCCRLLVDGIV